MIFRQYKNTNYWVSTCGNVYNMQRGNLLQGSSNRVTGYYVYKITINGIKKTRLIHRLVAETFIPNPENKKEVNHLDGNKYNNRLDNLEWATPSENQHHAFKLGLNHSNRKTSGIKMNPELIFEIKKLHKEGVNLVQISKRYNVTRGCISDIIHGRTWKDASYIKKIKNGDIVQFEDGTYVYLGKIDNEHNFAPFVSHIETLQA